MKKNIYLVIIWVITILAIVLGTIYHMTDWGDKLLGRAGIKTYSMNQELDNTLEAFDNISFDVDIAEIKIQTGDQYHIFCKSTKNLIPKCEVKNATLHLTQNSKNPHFPRRNGNDNCEIVITIPKDVTLSDITGNCNLGDLRINELTADTISVTCNLGEAIFSNVTAQAITCECNLGNCEIHDCSFDNLKADNDMGNVEVTSSQPLSDYSMDLSVSMGGIEVNGEDYTSHYKQKGESDKTITISNNMGSIEVEEK